MSHSWLQKKRKAELLELAQRANVPDADQLLKDDLVVALEEHLHANESSYAKQPEFSDFYGRAGSPVKRERSSPTAVAAADALVTTKARRRTLVKRDSEESTPVKTAVATRTPRVASRASRLSEVEIPASPAQLADVADRHFQAFGTKVVDVWEGSRIDDAREWLRENVSSVSAIQMLILVIEGAGLQYNQVSLYPVLVPGLGKKVDVPNVWGLLEAHWWARATLWTATSWLLPLIVSYFFNLTLRSNTHHKSPSRQYKIDPLTFNIVKAFLAYCAFYIPTQPDAQLAGQPNQVSPQRVAWGPWAEQTVSDVRANVPGGYNGLQIGAFVGILVSLYDAALKK